MMKPNAEILQELDSLNSPLAGLPREMPYAVPRGYFQGLAEGALRAAKGSDVPENYFQNLPQAMLAAAKAADETTQRTKQKTRIITLPVRRWAAAAVLLISLSIGGALFFNAQNGETVNTIAALPPDAVQDYVAANLDETDLLAATAGTAEQTAELSSLSDAELEAYLAEEGVLF